MVEVGGKKISVVVMAHPSRERFFSYLKEKLGDVPFSVDYENKGVWSNAKNAWMMHDFDSDYSITIQDDVIIGKDFYNNVSKYLVGDNVYNFYMGRRPRFKSLISDAISKRADSITLTNLHHECSWGLKTSRVKEMVDFTDRLNPESDQAFNKYIKHEKLNVIFTIPSLCDHRLGDSLHNLNKGTFPPGAAYFIGE